MGAADAEQHGHAGVVEVASELRGQPGEADDHAQLGDLRWLELERAELATSRRPRWRGADAGG